MQMVGVDGCRGGWALAVRTVGDTHVRFYVVESLDALVGEAKAGRAVVAVDMPIGLPEGEPTRACDAAARALLRAPRSSSVFAVPCRQAVLADTPEAARTANLRAVGRNISAQALGILPKIREVDALVDPALQARVRETHPEVVFAVLNHREVRTAMTSHKRTPSGRAERLQVLAVRGVVFDPNVERRRLGASVVGEDDLVDAAACLLTAERIAARHPGLLVLPEDGELRPRAKDSRGLRMEIVA